MITLILFQIKLFIFIFSLLFLVKNLYSFVKIIRLHQGKFDSSRNNMIAIGCAISYVITILISGF